MSKFGQKPNEKYNLLENLLPTFNSSRRYTDCMKLMFMNPPVEIVKFSAPGSGIYALWQGQYGHIAIMYLSLLYIRSRGRKLNAWVIFKGFCSNAINIYVILFFNNTKARRINDQY